jgi:hypothetical protein
MRLDITSGAVEDVFSDRFRDLDVENGVERRFDSGAERAGERWEGCDDGVGRGGIGIGGIEPELRSAAQARRTGIDGRSSAASMLGR